VEEMGRPKVGGTELILRRKSGSVNNDETDRFAFNSPEERDRNRISGGRRTEGGPGPKRASHGEKEGIWGGPGVDNSEQAVGQKPAVLLSNITLE